MKKCFFLFFLLLILVVTGFSQDVSDISIETGLSLTPGLFYNMLWDPGYNGSAAKIIVDWQFEKVFIGTGIELGYNFTGFNIIFPIRLSYQFAEVNSFAFLAYTESLPGMILSRPVPYFLIGVEMGASAIWNVHRKLALRFDIAPRYMTAPVYSQTVASMNSIDLTTSILVSIRFDKKVKP